MKRFRCVLFSAMVMVVMAGPVWAHFGMVIPSDQMVMQEDDRTVAIDLMFWHPFEGIGMELVKPARFAVVADGEEKDLLGSIKSVQTDGHQTWRTTYECKRPGVYTFFMEPKPYWEPTEDCYIVHYTKAVVTAFGDDEGWDEELGLKTEIVPLAKPYGLYAGNCFQGIVKLDGKAVPYAEVEVEYYDEDGSLKAPTDYMVTQAIKADGNGVFTYAAPRAGWWGFAALNTSDETKKHDGVDKDIELGAVLWVKFHDMK